MTKNKKSNKEQKKQKKKPYLKKQMRFVFFFQTRIFLKKKIEKN
jgi:hypothetical protein